MKPTEQIKCKMLISLCESITSVWKVQTYRGEKKTSWKYLTFFPKKMEPSTGHINHKTTIEIVMKAYVLTSFFPLWFFIHVTSWLQPPFLLCTLSAPSPTLSNPLPHYPLLFGEGEAPLGYHSTMVHPFPAGLSTSSLKEAQPGSQCRGKRI